MTIPNVNAPKPYYGWCHECNRDIVTTSDHAPACPVSHRDVGHPEVAPYFPTATDKTLGITPGSYDLNMPPFAVDIIDGQGNGDVSDAVLGIRGKVRDFGSGQDESTVYVVAVSVEEAGEVAGALHQWAEALRENDVDPCQAEWLAKRFEMVPGVVVEQPHPLPKVGAHVQLTKDVERFPHFSCPAGWTGEVTDVTHGVISVRMYRYLGHGAEEWHNEIVFSASENGDGFHDYCRILEAS